MHISPKKTRCHIIKIRVNLDEKTFIKNRAGPQATAEWLRQLAMDFHVELAKRPVRHFARIENKDPDRSSIVREIARIGNNLNQISRVLNSLQYNESHIDLIMLSTQLNLIWEELKYVQQNFS